MGKAMMAVTLTLALLACKDASQGRTDSAEAQRNERAVDRALEHIRRRAKITVTPLDFSGGPAAVRIRLRIKNGNGFIVKNPVVSCVASSSNGTLLDEHEVTVFSDIPAAGALTTKPLLFGTYDEQAKTMSCEIATWANANP